MTANINELRLRLSILKSSSTSFRLSPCVSTLPQMAPMVWAAYRQSWAAHTQPRSDGPRRPRLGRMRWWGVRARRTARMRSASASLSYGAAQPARYRKPAPSRARSAPRPPGTARAIWYELSLASFAAHLVVLALGRGARAPVRHATDKSKRWGTAIAPHTNRAESGGCPPLLQRLPHQCSSRRQRSRASVRALSNVSVVARTPPTQ